VIEPGGRTGLALKTAGIKPWQFLLAGKKMNGAIRCRHFAKVISQRKLIRCFQPGCQRQIRQNCPA
jgi:hypothetical protein